MKSDEPFLRHILDEVNYLSGHTQGLTYDRLLKDETLQRAFARSFEIIGEATKNLSPDLKKRHKEVDWSAMSGMRDVLIHRYFEVDWEIVWKIIRDDLPELKKAIGRALAGFKT